MGDVWTDLKDKGCRLAFERPFLDGATEGGSRMAKRQTYDEAEAKPLAQPAGGSASGLTPIADARLSPVPP
eukprot:9487223-Pyramimonas_sp.AAC.1